MSKFKVGDKVVCVDNTHPRLILGHKYRVSKIKKESGKYFVATETTRGEFFFEHRFEKVASSFKGNLK